MSGTNPPDGGGSGSIRNNPDVRQRVLAPPKAGLLKDFKSVVEETFFHDAPLRDFKGQTPAKKTLLGIQAVFPIVGWAREYNLRKLRGDVIAGLTIASLCIPQDIGYAKLANLDPKYGLYSSFVPPLVYAGMGSSRDIAIGPVAVVSLLLGTLCQAVIDPKDDPDNYLRLAFTATFFAGVFQFGLGLLRLGFLIDFLSHAAVVGFMGGAAITIALQQLKGFLGIKTFTKKTDIISVMQSVFENARHGGKRNKKLFWVPAIAPLISVIISTFFVFITRADKQGVQIVKHIDQGINPLSYKKLFFSGKYFMEGIRIGGIAGMVALTEAVAIARTFAAMKDYQIDGNKEMIALGTMNVAGSLTSCYIATGSFSRSAVNYMAGVHTAVSNIVMAIVVALTLEFITPLFKYTPNAILAAIIISAVLGLIDIDAAVLIWKIDKLDFLACMGAFFGVVFVSVEIGLLISVVISFAKILLQVTRPRTAILGKLPNSNVYRNTLQYPDAARIPGILIIRVDSAIYFSNSNYVRERASRWLREEQEMAKEDGMPAIKFVILEMSPVTDVDTSGIHSIEELFKSLEKQDIQLILANPGPVVIEKLYASKFVEEIGEKNIFLTVSDAVAHCAPGLAEQQA
ncbi:unnamed protein product [Arabidopsis arenosa]|uniref:STAS domain-containing protein n=1 Tax=Arabidopsis arenosa TaxID=38785 RepID=A0A8S2AP95_ARAAE|nr:unnamed protein product [Arabidopsis arenosa]